MAGFAPSNYADESYNRDLMADAYSKGLKALSGFGNYWDDLGRAAAYGMKPTQDYAQAVQPQISRDDIIAKLLGIQEAAAKDQGQLGYEYAKMPYQSAENALDRMLKQQLMETNAGSRAGAMRYQALMKYLAAQAMAKARGAGGVQFKDKLASLDPVSKMSLMNDYVKKMGGDRGAAAQKYVQDFGIVPAGMGDSGSDPMQMYRMFYGEGASPNAADAGLGW